MYNVDNNDIAHTVTPFPRKALVLPGLVPMAVFVLMFGAEALGAKLNPHGVSGIIVVLVMIYGFAAALFELVAISRALNQLARFPLLRTSENLFAVLFAVIFVIAMMWLGFRAWLG